MRAAGKIRYLGFSFHDDYEVFEEILNYYPWDFCQIQLNYMDTEIQAGMKGYDLAEEKGIPVIVMEPVKGGMLASLPTEIEEQLTKEREQASIASWALRFVGTLPNVKVILSGMSTMGQVEDNLSIFETFEPLSEKEQKLIENTSGYFEIACEERMHRLCLLYAMSGGSRYSGKFQNLERSGSIPEYRTVVYNKKI